MNEVINIQQIDNLLLVSSREVAENFGKQHKNVIQSIENIKAENSALTNMFIESTYQAGTGKNYKEYLMNRDGFSLIVMGFTGKKALDWKLKYIDAFNKMEEQLRNKIPQIAEKDLMLLQLFSKDKIKVAEAHQRLVEIEVEEATTPLLETIEEQRPEVEFANRVQEDGKTTYSIAETSKLLKLPFGRNKLMERLRENNYLRENNEPYQHFIDRGIFIVKLSDVGHKRVPTTRVTGKGLKHLEKVREKLIS